MEKVKTIKIWPSAHVEVRLHVTEQMIKDFKKCTESVVKIMQGEECKEIPDCKKCNWKNVTIGEEGACSLFTDKIIERLKEEL